MTIALLSVELFLPMSQSLKDKRMVLRRLKDRLGAFNVTVAPDLQLARIYYTQMGDERQRKDTKRALERATPFLRRGIGARLRLRRVPELMFHFDESIEKHDRIEKILIDLKEERAAREG